jgi:hypothetical protein
MYYTKKSGREGGRGEGREGGREGGHAYIRTPQSSELLEEIFALSFQLGEARLTRHGLHQETVRGGLA